MTAQKIIVWISNQPQAGSDLTLDYLLAAGVKAQRGPQGEAVIDEGEFAQAVKDVAEIGHNDEDLDKELGAPVLEKQAAFVEDGE